VYFLGVGEHTALVAVHQLAPTRDTLWLRILGRGKIQKKAIDEVLALPKDDPLRNLALELVSSWTIRTEQQSDLSPEEQEQLMNVSSAYAEWKQKTLQEGEMRGRAIGQLEGRLEAAREILLQLLAHKFGPLSAQVISQIQAIDNAEKLEQLPKALFDALDLQGFLQNL
jgi:predicted transposase YdaD